MSRPESSAKILIHTVQRSLDTDCTHQNKEKHSSILNGEINKKKKWLVGRNLNKPILL